MRLSFKGTSTGCLAQAQGTQQPRRKLYKINLCFPKLLLLGIFVVMMIEKANTVYTLLCLGLLAQNLPLWVSPHREILCKFMASATSQEPLQTCWSASLHAVFLRVLASFGQLHWETSPQYLHGVYNMELWLPEWVLSHCTGIYPGNQNRRAPLN